MVSVWCYIRETLELVSVGCFMKETLDWCQFGVLGGRRVIGVSLVCNEGDARLVSIGCVMRENPPRVDLNIPCVDLNSQLKHQIGQVVV